VGATKAFETAIVKGATRRAATKAAVTYVVVQAAAAAGSFAVSSQVVAEVIAYAGLNESEVQVGLAVFASIGILSGLAARSASRRAANRAAGRPSPKATNAAGRGIWDLIPLERWRAVEQRLGKNLPDQFPVIDKFVDGIATSIKSLDLKLDSYQKPNAVFNMVRRYIDEVAEFKGAKRAGDAVQLRQIRGRALDLAIPPGATLPQRAQLDQLRFYGAIHGVQVNIVELQ
jgi:filamentous hemagglutinin